MPELRCFGVTDTGTAEHRIQIEPDAGRIYLSLPLPEGMLQSVEAELPWTMETDEKLFMNGYQTWTCCPELGKWDIQRGLKRVPAFLKNGFALDRYGDYHFVDYSEKRGESHGFSYCYFRRGNVYRLIASLNETPGYTIFYYSSRSGRLRLSRDCAGVHHGGGDYPAFCLFFAQGTEKEVFDAWFAALGIHPRTQEKLWGYSSWYNRYQAITQKTIHQDLAGCTGRMPRGSLFQIDDGWEQKIGDWLEPDKQKFPGGMKALAEEIHAEGYQAGLWLAPFVCEKGSALFQEHPQWLLSVNGQPWKCGCNWSGFYSLDIDCSAVQEYLKNVFHMVLNEWGFDLVKLDFLYGAAPFGNERESRAARMQRAMGLLRGWCGDKKILGCGVPVMPAFGLVDYCRVGCDVGLDWDDKPHMRLLHRERVSTRQSIENTLFRRQLNGRAYGSDPDVFFLRTENCHLTRLQKQKLATVNALFSGILLTSDIPAAYTPEEMEEYKKIHRLFLEAKDARFSTDGGLTIQYTLDGREYTLP